MTFNIVNIFKLGLKKVFLTCLYTAQTAPDGSGLIYLIILK